MSESVALANVPEVGGKLSSSICHKPPNTQGVVEGQGAGGGAVSGGSRLRGVQL